MFSPTGKTITSVTNCYLDFNWNLFFLMLVMPSFQPMLITPFWYYIATIPILLPFWRKNKKKKPKQTQKSLNTLKDGARKGEKKKKRKDAGSALRLRWKLNWFSEFSNSCCITNADKQEVLSSCFQRATSITLKESGQYDYDFQEKSVEHSMLNLNKPEGPVTIVNSFIIYNPLDQQWARKQKKTKQQKPEKYFHSIVWFSL